MQKHINAMTLRGVETYRGSEFDSILNKPHDPNNEKHNEVNPPMN